MKKIFSCSNHLELAPYKSLLERHEIPFLVKNEYAMGAVGELPVDQSWPQLWVLDDSASQQARALCLELEQEITQTTKDWQCPFCGELNAGSFEICWHCEALPKHAS